MMARKDKVGKRFDKRYYVDPLVEHAKQIRSTNKEERKDKIHELVKEEAEIYAGDLCNACSVPPEEWNACWDSAYKNAYTYLLWHARRNAPIVGDYYDEALDPVWME